MRQGAKWGERSLDLVCCAFYHCSYINKSSRGARKESAGAMTNGRIAAFTRLLYDD